MKKILILDKNSTEKKRLNMELTHQFQCTITCFEDTTTLYDSIQNQTPDLILLIDDSQETQEILEEIKSMHISAPIIVLSKQRSIKKAVLFIKLGATDYIDQTNTDYTEELYQSIGNALNYVETKSKLNRIENGIKQETKNFFAIGIAGLFVVVLLYVFLN